MKIRNPLKKKTEKTADATPVPAPRRIAPVSATRPPATTYDPARDAALYTPVYSPPSTSGDCGTSSSGSHHGSGSSHSYDSGSSHSGGSHSYDGGSHSYDSGSGSSCDSGGF